MRKLLPLLLLLAGCATTTHPMEVIFLSLGLSKQSAEATAAANIKSVNMPYKILSSVETEDNGVWTVKQDVAFDVPNHASPGATAPAPIDQLAFDLPPMAPPGA